MPLYLWTYHRRGDCLSQVSRKPAFKPRGLVDIGYNWYKMKKGFLAFEGGRTRAWHLAREDICT